MGEKETMIDAGRRLAPFEWAYTRPFGKIVMDSGRDTDLMLRHLRPYKEHLPEGTAATDGISATLLMYGCAQAGIDAMELPSRPFVLWDTQMAMTMHSFSKSGRNVFSFDRDLTESFLHTDVGEARIGDIVHPYPAYYLQFDPETPITLPNGGILEGVMVHGKEEHDLGTVLKALPVSRGGTWPNVADWGYAMAFQDTDPELGLTDAIARSAGEKIDDEAVSHATHPYAPGLIPQAPEILRLVANAIMYVTRYAGDCRMEWPDVAPRDLVEKARAGRRAAEKELIRTGHVRTRLVTLAAPARGEAGEGDGRTVRAHWRRGPWKRQPYGPGSSLRKLILVPATRVAYRGAADETESRTYAVSAPKEA